MSGIPGVFNRDGRPAEPSMVGRMIGAAPHRGPDGARCWTSGSVALGHQQMGRLPEDVPQPVVDVSREVVVSLDGRIDNRTELASLLFTDTRPFRTPSDAELVLAAYERWGVECAIHLLGDFAFAVWDGPRQRMFCARDAMGIKPFYYFLGTREFVWASDLRQILSSGALPSIEPNEGMVAEYLARQIQSQDETLYRGVMRLPAAHTITVTAERVRIARYWQVDTAADIHYGTDDEYADHFLDLFGKAVSCRLRSDEGTPAAYLSGGLDSSSVVGMARSLGASVDTYSLVFPQDRRADERPYIEDVVRRWNLTSHLIVPPAIDGRVCRAHVARRRDTLDLPADLAGECLMARMRERGARVVLTGVGGDYCFSGTLYHYADLLQRGDVIGFLRQAWQDRGVADAGWSIWQPLLSGVRPLIPRRWRRAVRPMAKRLGLVPALPDWIEPSFAARVALADRLRPPAWPEEAPTFARRQVCEQFASGWPYLLLEAGERSAAEYGLEERHPFFDRRLIEFGVSLPEAQRWRGQQTKYVLRRAMGGVLPESVRERNGKGDFRATVAQAVEAIGGAGLFDGLTVASHGWVDQKRAQALYSRSRAMFAADHEDYCDGMFKLWMIGGIELWYGMTCIEGCVHEPQSRSVESDWTVRQPAGREAPAALPSSRTH